MSAKTTASDISHLLEGEHALAYMRLEEIRREMRDLRLASLAARSGPARATRLSLITGLIGFLFPSGRAAAESDCRQTLSERA